MHYNDILTRPWRQAGCEVVYQPSCLVRPYTNLHWNIRWPEVHWTDRTRVILHCQDFLSIHGDRCPELEMIQAYYGDRSDQVTVIHWNFDLRRVYKGPVSLIHFATHSYEILQNLRNLSQYQDWRVTTHAERSRRWQCLNGIPRGHRRAVHQWLRSRPKGVTCLGREDPLPQDAYHDVYTWTGDALINENNFMRLRWLYDHTWINIVTETQYTESPGIISEKTLFALLARQIPIFIGYRGMVEDCRRLGFDVFDDVVDHGYDDLEDHERWRCALELNEQLLFGDQDFEYLWSRLDRQRDYLLDQWPRIMIRNHDHAALGILATERDLRT